VAVPLVDLRAQYALLRPELDAAVARIAASQQFILGPEVESFEDDVARYTGARHAVGCASGTDALLLALRALELEPGAEVVVPAFTFFATAGAVWNAGLRPVFADIDAATFNLTPDTVRPVLTERTRAVIVVHLYGQMAAMEPLQALSREAGFRLIEDAAQAFGARQRVAGEWRQAGSLGDVGCYSFFPAKTLGGYGDAGMVVTDDAAVADRVRKLRVHGGRQMYHHEMVGTNSRLDAIQAAVLAVKLPHVDDWIDARRRHAAAYRDGFAGTEEHVVTPTEIADNAHAYGVYTLRAQGRDGLKEHLDGRRIGNAIYYPVALHLQECFRALGYREGAFPCSEQACREVISLPVYPELSDVAREEVVAGVRDFYSR
jgi:dTDP-4-amino-4,6-dideoxygalactose transaminase